MILLPPPDFVVSSLEVDDMYTTGSTLRVELEVSNVGGSKPFESYWRDELVRQLQVN